MAANESEKARRYIELLDSARCNARWDEIPELTRKVAKHAPHRTCLVLTAQTEAQVAGYRPPDRPPTATSSSLAKLITPLLAAIDGEQTHREDAFQATVCLGWIHWVLQEPLLATSRLPKDIIADITTISETPHQSKAWVQVCALKAGYIKGFSQEKTSSPSDGLETYKSLIPLLVSLPSSLGSFSPEFRLWTERLLSRMVAVTMRSKPLGEWLDLESMLQMFHLWISLFRSGSANSRVPGTTESTRQPPSVVELGSEVDYSRWDVWMAYYQTLSEVLLLGYIYAPTYSDKHPELLNSRHGISDDVYISCRLRQRAELKRVEASIETKLLEETRFPKAMERNSRVERWADAVMQNWQILCGPTWRDEELGEGGKSAIARGVLDTLYRAATKSFHSTQILRYLFNVHAYVTEFDLAFKAFDTYVELVQKGKDREDKTGEPQYSLDNDDITLHTVSNAIKILCHLGDRKDVEKARQISVKLRRWVEKAVAAAEAQESADSNKDTLAPIRVPVSPTTIAGAYRALGLCEVTWAHLTFDAGSRNGHQQKAVEYFRTSLNMSFGNGTDLETSFSLALVLAEMRELSPAIKVVKQAIARPARGDFSTATTMTGASMEPISRSDSIDFSRERKLIPFWHLLTLLLTAKADLANAARTSNAAFEQFGDEAFLFGEEPHFKSEHLQDLEKPKMLPPKALIDHMERSEKESVIQVKVTQIALKEAVHGAADAVDSSAELLALYARLFGDPRDELKTHPRPTTSRPPKSAVSTLRHSVFGRVTRSRSRHGRKPESVPSVPDLPISARSDAISTTTTAAPTIQITTEDGSSSVSRHLGSGTHSRDGTLFRTKSNHGGSTTHRKAPSVKTQRRSRSQGRRSPNSSRPTTPSDDHYQENAITTNDVPHTTMPRNHGSRSESKISNFSLPRPITSMSEAKVSSPNQPLRTIPHNLSPQVSPPPVGHKEQPPKQDLRLPAPHPASGEISPEPIFPIIQERRHRVSLLVDLWLFIAGLYTRAAVFDDAKAAIDEAGDLVNSLEAQLAIDSSSAKAFGARCWGGGKSIEELWGDVWAARGDLLLSQALSYEAISSYEKALSHFPDHPSAIVGLSGLLLDVANKTIEPELPEPPLFPDFHNGSSANGKEALQSSNALTSKATLKALSSVPPDAAAIPSNDLGTNTLPKEPSPKELNRLAARDRAYALLNSLTKLGSGWDYSEAWFALARSYELSGQIEKAKEVLWWCVELEDTRPLRQWSCVRSGSF